MKTSRLNLLGLRNRLILLGLLGLAVVHPINAGTLSRLSFVSNGGAYINDTLVNANTSPLAITATGSLDQPFLNASDSTVSLAYGEYYAIAFRGFGAHVGPGTISFILNGTTEYSQNVTFPDPTSASEPIASFDLPDGDTVRVSATGLAADRIRIVADGAGLSGDGTPDAFYSLSYRPKTPVLTIVPTNPGLALITWSPAMPDFVLQTRLDLEKSVWSNSPSGSTNPIVVSTEDRARFFRLLRP